MSCYHAGYIILVEVYKSVPQVLNKHKLNRVHIDTTILHSNNRFISNSLTHISFINTLYSVTLKCTFISESKRGIDKY